MADMNLDLETIEKINVIIFYKKKRTVSFFFFDGFNANVLRMETGDDQLTAFSESAVLFLISFIQNVLGKIFIAKEEEDKIYFLRQDCYEEIMAFRIATQNPFENSGLN